MNDQQWKNLPGFEGYYQVSDYGQVRSVSRLVNHGRWSNAKRLAEGQLLNRHPNHKGYLHVTLCMDGQRYVREVHQLIALTFLGPKAKGYHIHHVNGNKRDNRLSNLIHLPSHEHHSLHHRGEGCHKAKLTDKDVIEILDLLDKGIYQKDIAEKFGVSRSTIGEIARGKTWKHLSSPVTESQP